MVSISSRQLIDLGRIAAIVTCVGLLYSPSVATIGLIVCYVAFIASGKEAVSRFKEVLVRPLVYWGMGFLGVVAIGMTYASVPWHDRWLDLYKWRTILWVFVTLALFDEERWKQRLLVMFLVGTAVAVLGSFMAAAGWFTFQRGANALLRNSGTQSMAFACAALTSLWLALENKLVGGKRWIPVALGAAYLLNIVFVTNGRSGYAAIGVGGILLMSSKLSWKYRALVILGAFVLGGVAYSASPRMQGKIQEAVVEWNSELASESLTNFGSRRVFYENSLEILQKHWLMGVGSGGFVQIYAEHVDMKYDPSNWRALHTSDPHNQYFLIGIQQGIAGVSLFLGWIIAVAREREAPRDYHRLAVAILAGWCMTSLFSSHFRTFAEGHLLATFLGTLLAVPKTSETGGKAESSERNKMAGI